MSITDVLFSIVGIEERETKIKVWNYYNSVFFSSLFDAGWPFLDASAQNSLVFANSCCFG